MTRTRTHRTHRTPDFDPTPPQLPNAGLVLLFVTWPYRLVHDLLPVPLFLLPMPRFQVTPWRHQADLLLLRDRLYLAGPDERQAAVNLVRGPCLAPAA